MKSSTYSGHSRLQKLEERKNRKQAFIFSSLTVLFLVLLIFVGFPAFVRLVGALGDVRSSKIQPDKTDTIAPITPTLMADWEATSSAKTTVRGYGEPGSKVNLKDNGKVSGDTIIADDGSYAFDVTLEPGDNEFMTYATDLAGNKSQDSMSVNILFDNEPPILEVTSPEDGAKFYEDKEILVAGTTDIDASIKINSFIATVDTEGNFVRRIQLNNGDNEIIVEAKDKAGNKTEKKLKVSYNP